MNPSCAHPHARAFAPAKPSRRLLRNDTRRRLRAPSAAVQFSSFFSAGVHAELLSEYAPFHSVLPHGFRIWISRRPPRSCRRFQATNTGSRSKVTLETDSSTWLPYIRDPNPNSGKAQSTSPTAPSTTASTPTSIPPPKTRVALVNTATPCATGRGLPCAKAVQQQHLLCNIPLARRGCRTHGSRRDQTHAAGPRSARPVPHTSS